MLADIPGRRSQARIEFENGQRSRERNVIGASSKGELVKWSQRAETPCGKRGGREYDVSLGRHIRRDHGLHGL
jgi:hypothetical protein